MQHPISVVIICLNAADSIEKAINSVRGLTTDIVVSDSGSTDGTLAKVEAAQVILLEVAWRGYGDNKNEAVTHARYDWILSVDADEFLHPSFTGIIQQTVLDNPLNQYQFRRLNFLGDKPIRFGEWSKDKVIRLYNRTGTAWNNAPVHEELVSTGERRIIKSAAIICHRTAPDIATYRIKIKRYAQLMADKYFIQQRKVNLLKLYGSPVINFLQNYIFRLGFLDGKEGWQIAFAHAGYTYQKYRLLYHMLHR